MRFHAVQHDVRALGKIAEVFQAKMMEKGVLPKNPWKAKRAEAWLAKMGARMKPGCRRFDPHSGQVDCSNYVNFKVECIPPKWRVPNWGGPPKYELDEPAFMRVEIPWELADKILALGYLP